jgi:aminoglycoside 6'-N-acetyltransferase
MAAMATQVHPSTKIPSASPSVPTTTKSQPGIGPSVPERLGVHAVVMATTRPLPVLRGERVVLRPVREDDAGPLLALLTEPAVAAWWHEWDAARVRRDLIAEQEWEVVVAIEVEGVVAGLLLVGEDEQPEYRHASLDIALATAYQGRGIGGEAMRLVIEHLIAERGHHRFTIDPAVANERAIRAYERLGFKRVGVMRRYERGADGSWHDSLLMDLLAEEFSAL